MPRRKRNDDGAGDSSAKKSKVECSIGGRAVRWEWEADDGWQVYGADFQEQLCAAYESGKLEVLLDMGKGVKMRIIFDRSVQKNKLTGWERRVRACLQKDSDKAYYVWEWEDEHGKWNAYNAKTSLDLTVAEAEGEDTVSVVACHRAYTIHVDQGHQVNDTTGVKRNVQCRKSECKAPADATMVKSEPKEEEEEAEETKPARKSARGKAASAKVKVEPGTSSGGGAGDDVKKAVKSKSASGRKGKSGASAGDSPEKVKTVVVKGKAPVDPECPKAKTMHVFAEGKTIYDCMTNQTNLSNNNNKYYLMQILEDDTKKSYSVWFRWGRVGKNGQNSLIPCGPDLEEAKDIFCKKFYDKTRNDWALRGKFVKVAGKYDLVKIDYSADQDAVDEDTTDGAKPDTKVPDSKLDKRLQSLINLICDVKSMEDAVVEMKYDAKRAPLGKLTKDQIKAGYTALKKIETCISNNSLGAALIQACDEFYTRIPHAFGMQRPPIIRTKEEVKNKMTLLEALDDIEVAMKIIRRRTSDENPIDTHYKDLKCDLEPLDHTHADFKLVNKFLQDTHAPTHNQYAMQILDVFDVSRGNEDANFKDYGNTMLLWHGSRLTNWMGILSQGLRIAPPEAPVTGYMFGKGVYFADVSSKSANYCYATKSKKVGLVLLCEVSMGKCVELLAADINAASLPDYKTTHSVCGQGAVAPDPKHHHTLTNGTIVPIGKLVKTGVKNPSGYTLNYNEFIVYNTNQIRMKYLAKVQFNFKY